MVLSLCEPGLVSNADTIRGWVFIATSASDYSGASPSHPCLPAARARLPHLPVLHVGCSSRYPPTQQCLLALSSPRHILLPTIPISRGSVSSISATPSPGPKFLSSKPSLPDNLNPLLTSPQPASPSHWLLPVSANVRGIIAKFLIACVSQCSEQN